MFEITDKMPSWSKRHPDVHQHHHRRRLIGISTGKHADVPKVQRTESWHRSGKEWEKVFYPSRLRDLAQLGRIHILVNF